MTSLAAGRGAPAAMIDGRIPSPAYGTRVLVCRLRDEAGRLVAFSETKLLLREAASAIERLEHEAERLGTELAKATAEPARERTAHRTP